MLRTARYLWSNRIKSPFFSYRWAKDWGKRCFTFPGLVKLELASSLWRLRGVQLGFLSSIGCRISTPSQLSVGDGVFIGRATIQLLERVQIGSYAVINDGVEILTGSHDPSDLDFRHVLGPVKIGDYAWIATKAIILPGVSIGEGAIVGAGSVVSRDVAPYEIVVGNPARPVKSKRAIGLRYNPNMFRACYEAWLGHPKPKVEGNE